MKRHKMSKKSSRRSFRKHAGTHKRNRPHKISRGGFRL